MRSKDFSMKTFLQLAALLTCVVNFSVADTPNAVSNKSVSSAIASAPDLKIELAKVSRESVFVSDSHSIWGGSVAKGADGKYHMLYSRWPKDLGWAWVTDSEIAHAVADLPMGPYRHQDIALARRGKEYWDGWCTHNPTVHKFGGKYYLYYMGNTGDGKVVGTPGKHKLNWRHRNNQRIGVAVAEDPSGPWTRMDNPVLDISANDSAADALMTSNPSVCQRPDGKILMVYKAVGKKFALPSGGPVVHLVAIADRPTGPFKKMPNPVFTFQGERFPAEDPYIWFQNGKYRAIVKRIKHVKKKRRFSLVQYDSIDGIAWHPSKHHEISDPTVTWEDGTLEKLDHLERPQVVIENGVPVALTCAADRIDDKKVRQSFNIQIPLIITEDSPAVAETKQTQKKNKKVPVPTWTDAQAAARETSSFRFSGEYTYGDTAIQVVPAEERFYLSIYQGGLPGAGWDGGQIKHQWIEADAIADRLVGFTKFDRAASLEFTKPPADAIVLFDGTKNKQWKFATVTDGLLQAGAATRENFKDFKLHFECMTPFKPSLPLSHPGRGNSGVFAVGAYEVQIIDTFGLDLAPEAWQETKLIKKTDTWCGSIYGICAPSINVCAPPLTWQTFDVEFTAARFDVQNKTKTSDAVITVHLNGVLIQDHVKLPRGTGGGPKGPRAEVESGPIYFQKHGNPVQYRNIWIQVK